eukprot:102231-Alexandrium_andersonii.AAC.1
MDDADIVDVANFRAMDSDFASAVPESSGDRRAGPGGQAHRDDITEAALGPELVASARSGEIRFMEPWMRGASGRSPSALPAPARGPSEGD